MAHSTRQMKQESQISAQPTMIVGVKFPSSYKVYDFFSGIHLSIGDVVICSTSQGESIGRVINIKSHSHYAHKWVLKVVGSKVPKPLVIGSHVKRIDGTFEGTITAFEYGTNKAVCISDKIAKYMNDRTRYVYGLDELQLIPEYTFKPGVRYLINGNIPVLAVESVFHDDEVMLFEHNTGELRYKHVPRNVSRSELLKRFNIHELV